MRPWKPFRRVSARSLPPGLIRRPHLTARRRHASFTGWFSSKATSEARGPVAPPPLKKQCPGACKNSRAKKGAFGMTEIECTEQALVVHIQGADKFWALKSQMQVP